MGMGMLGATTGWLVAGLTAVNVSLPYLLRGRRFAIHGWSVPYLERMRPHYWIGLTVAGLTLLHAGIAMAGPMRSDGLYVAGLWIATGGLLMVAGQAVVGIRLRTLRGEERLRVRKTHFRFMLGLVAVGAAHMVADWPV